MALKISKEVSYLNSSVLTPHPWNPDRTVPELEETPEQKEERRAFEASILRNGVEKPILVTLEKNKKGLYEILRGRRRWTAIRKFIKKGSLPENTKIPVQFLESSFEETGEEAVFGDNDNALRYTGTQRRQVIIDRFGLENILEDTRGGDRGNQFVGGRLAQTQGLVKQVHSRFPWWPIGTIQYDVALIRKEYRTLKKFPEPNEDQIDNLNNLVLSWWEIRQSIDKIREDRTKQLTALGMKFDERISKREKEASFLNTEFRKFGGIETYLEKYLGSKRPEFSPLKKIDGLKEFIKTK